MAFSIPSNGSHAWDGSVRQQRMPAALAASSERRARTVVAGFAGGVVTLDASVRASGTTAMAHALRGSRGARPGAGRYSSGTGERRSSPDPAAHSTSAMIRRRARSRDCDVCQRRPATHPVPHRFSGAARHEVRGREGCQLPPPSSALTTITLTELIMSVKNKCPGAANIRGVLAGAQIGGMAGVMRWGRRCDRY